MRCQSQKTQRNKDISNYYFAEMGDVKGGVTATK